MQDLLLGLSKLIFEKYAAFFSLLVSNPVYFVKVSNIPPMVVRNFLNYVCVLNYFAY